MLHALLPRLLRGCYSPPWQPSPSLAWDLGAGGWPWVRARTLQASPANSSSLGCLIPIPGTFLGAGVDQSPRVPALLLLWANLAISASLI